MHSRYTCITEAVTGKALTPRNCRRSKPSERSFCHAVFIQRSARFSDRVWDLVTRMCTFRSRERLKFGDTVRALEEVGLEEARVRTPFPVHRIARNSGGDAEEQLELVFSFSGGDIEQDDYEPDALELEQRARARLNDLWCSPPSTGGELMESAGERYRAILARATRPTEAVYPGGSPSDRETTPCTRSTATSTGLLASWVAKTRCSRRSMTGSITGSATAPLA